MSSIDLEILISSLSQDIEFQYAGIDGAICPYSLSDIGFSYGDLDKQYTSVEALMKDPVLHGECLRTVAPALKIY